MKQKKFRKVLSLLLVLTMMLSVCLPVMAAGTCSISILSTAPKNVSVTVGQLYSVDLSTVFSDSDHHELVYSLSGGDFGNQTKITKDGHFIFSVGKTGNYYPVITAECSGGSKASFKMNFTVEAAPEGSSSQYNYDETPASQVKVWVTVNSDGVPIKGNDENLTPLLHVPVTVPYFDLGLYGLERFYRYGTDNGKGPYTGSNVIERPTALHLYIYLLEHFYMGLPDEACCKGTSGLLEYQEPGVVSNMFDATAYEATNPALSITGSPTSLYCHKFWGHDENLMYYRNHVYPLMNPGWGSTADYILLSDNDAIDIGMFTDWNFWSDGGAFARFDAESYEVEAGSELVVQALKYQTRSVSDGGTEDFVPVADINVDLYDSNYKKVASAEGRNGTFKITVPKEAGTYYLLGTDTQCGTPNARYASATATIEVKGDPYSGCLFTEIKSDISKTPITDFTSGKCFINHYDAPGEFPYYKVKVPEGTKTVTVKYPANAVAGMQSMCALFDPKTGDVSWDFMAGSDYDFTVNDNPDGSFSVELPAEFLIQNKLAIALESGDNYSYFNTFGFEYGSSGGKTPVSGVKLDKTSLKMTRGDTVKLTATVEPAEAENKAVLWTSDNKLAADVDTEGNVTAVGSGTADIIVRTIDGGKTARCTVEVTDPTEPELMPDGYYEIKTAEQLKWFADKVNSASTENSAEFNARVMNDIDLSSVCGPNKYSWVPIGNAIDYKAYTGTFDGNGYTLSNLYIDESFSASQTANGAYYYRSLFGQCKNATIKNLSVSGSVKTNARKSAGICGYMMNGVIENCHNAVNVNSGDQGVGGIISTAASNVQVLNCSNSGKISGHYGNIGGIMGSGYNATIKGCYNTGEIFCNGVTTSAGGNTAGIVGEIKDYMNVVTDCYNRGTVKVSCSVGSAPHMGGIVGRLNTRSLSDINIAGCYNTGSLISEDTTKAGGIIGIVENYSHEDISSKLVIERCYYLDTAASGDKTGGQSLSRSEMISDKLVADINGAGTAYKAGAEYPILSWQPDEQKAAAGDVNGDGYINAADAAIVYAHVNGHSVLTESQLGAADVNGDGTVNAVDAAMIYAKVNGKLDKFPNKK